MLFSLNRLYGAQNIIINYQNERHQSVSTSLKGFDYAGHFVFDLEILANNSKEKKKSNFGMEEYSLTECSSVLLWREETLYCTVLRHPSPWSQSL
jgi:hypothetical protein